MEKVNLDVVKPWITKKLIEILGFEDDVVMQYVLNMLESEKVRTSCSQQTKRKIIMFCSFKFILIIGESSVRAPTS